jgi:phosphoribosylformylglycinamidine synthase
MAPREIAPQVYEIPVRDASPRELDALSAELGLGLSRDEMARVQRTFKALGREPTDVELQSIAQAWSEHCSYKTSKPFLRKHILPKARPRDLLVAGEDAAVVRWDGDWCYVFKMESHNHPSAVEPYGGASTGVGGILRDVVCMGAQPIALADVLGFAPPGTKPPAGTLPPEFLLSGVVAGIRDYGNRVGIPTVCGAVVFHLGYLTNCVVNAGCVGVVRRREVVHSRVSKPGDLLVLVGGPTGRDGIHGVTFASKDLGEMGEEASRRAVQLGDAILKEPTIHALRECVERGLLSGMKDLGGGGLSCVVGEMAHAGGVGAEVDLERVPLREGGLAPWEIWVSESQERFMLAVEPARLGALLGAFERWDVPAVPVGRAVGEKVVRLRWKGRVVYEMATDFIVEAPEVERPVRRVPVREDGELHPPVKEAGATLLRLLASPNLCSRDPVVRRYDHEVRAATLLKPLQGRIGREAHGDAVVLKPRPDSFRGLALAVGVNPRMAEADPYHGARAAVDEVVRNLAACGAEPHTLVDSLNFGNPERPEALGAFDRALEGLGSMAREAGLPFVSGNVSLYNESGGRAIPPTPVLFGVGRVADIRKAVSTPLKRSGDLLFRVGETRPEFGGSALYDLLGRSGGAVPRSDGRELARKASLLRSAVTRGLVAACHDLSEGGLAAAAAEMAMGGGLGADLRLDPALRSDVALFSESCGRWLVEVPRARRGAFERLLGRRAVPAGAVRGSRLVVRSGPKPLLSLPLDRLERAWRGGLG